MTQRGTLGTPHDGGRKGKRGEMLRFAVVGVAATALQYAVYVALLHWLTPRMANTVGYAVSFIFNYIASTHYTFKVKSSARRGAGFALSHAVNYLLQTATLSLFLWMGLPKAVAMLPVFAVCVPVNFVLVRFFLKR